MDVLIEHIHHGGSWPRTVSARSRHADRRSLVDGAEVQGGIAIRHIGRVIDGEKGGVSGGLIPSAV
jgi:hypothetical protein